MSNELDTSANASFDTFSSDLSDSGGFDDSVDIGGLMDDSADVGDFSNDSSDVESLMDAPSDIGSIMDNSAEFSDFADQPSDAADSLDPSFDIETLMGKPAGLSPAADVPPAFTDDLPDVESITDASPIIESPADEPPDIASAADDVGDFEGYYTTPNSNIPILQADGAVDTLENMMDVSAGTDGAPLDVEPYDAAPNSEIPILQEDGMADSLENIMAANADLEEPPLDRSAFENPPSDLADESAADLLEAMMNDCAESDRSGVEELSPDVFPVADASGFSAEEDIAPISMIGNDAADTGDPVEPIHISQSDVEMYIENSTDAESLQQMRDGIASGQIQIDADTRSSGDDAIDETSGPILVRDPNEQWEIGNHAIDDTIEAMRDDLRDKGMEDGPEVEAIVMAERARMQEELAQDISGATPSQNIDFTEPVQDEPLDVPQDIDYDAVFSGLDSYDFDGIDIGSDVERLESSLESFQPETWENLSINEQKAAIADLADYVEDVIGFDHPPRIVYYNNPVAGDYGGYSPSTNTLEVNEYMLYDSDEAADTVSHELWHAYQHQRALNPQSTKDFQYQYGFANYIRPDIDFAAYQDQLVEAEARAFAQQFKDRLSAERRSI